MSNPTAIAPVGKSEVSHEESAVSVGEGSRRLVTRRKPFHATFVLHRGIFERTRLHLTNLGAAARAEVWLKLLVLRAKGGRAALDGQPRAAVPTSVGQGAGLTWLSLRCLSSYLNFSAQFQ